MLFRCFALRLRALTPANGNLDSAPIARQRFGPRTFVDPGALLFHSGGRFRNEYGV